MTDKRFSANEPNAKFMGPVIDGLFKWETSADAVPGDPVNLNSDGPPVGVIKAVVGTAAIGVVKQPAKQNEKVVVITRFAAVVAMTCGGTVTRGAKQKVDASSKITDALIGDVGTGATGVTEGAIIGTALQSGALNDIVYVGIGW